MHSDVKPVLQRIARQVSQSVSSSQKEHRNLHRQTQVPNFAFCSVVAVKRAKRLNYRY